MLGLDLYPTRWTAWTGAIDGDIEEKFEYGLKAGRLLGEVQTLFGLNLDITFLVLQKHYQKVYRENNTSLQEVLDAVKTKSTSIDITEPNNPSINFILK